MANIIPSNTVLSGVVAFLDVRSCLGNATMLLKDNLRALGATVSHTLNSHVTHIIFRKGSASTKSWALHRNIPVVSPEWIKASRIIGMKAPISKFAPVNDEALFSLEDTLPCANSKVIANSRTLCEAAPIFPRIRVSQKFERPKTPPEMKRFLQRLGKTVATRDTLFDSSDNSFDDESVAPAQCDAKVIVATSEPSNSVACICNTNLPTIQSRDVKQRNNFVNSPSQKCTLIESSARRLTQRDPDLPVDDLLMASSKRTVSHNLNNTPLNPPSVNIWKRVSRSAPLTPDLLMSIVRNAHTPKSTTLSGRSVNKTKQRNGKKHSSRAFIGRVCASKRKPKSNNQSKLDKTKPSVVPTSSCSRLPLLLGDDNREAFSSNIFLRRNPRRRATSNMLCNSNNVLSINTPASPNPDSIRRSTSRSRRISIATVNVKSRKSRQFCVDLDANDTSFCPNVPKLKVCKPQNHSVVQKSKELGTMEDPHRVQKSRKSLSQVVMITGRDSLEEFQPQISTTACQKRNNFNPIQILFSGTYQNDELLLVTSLKTSNLKNFEIVKSTSGAKHYPFTKAVVNPSTQFSHLVTVCPIRRTLKLFQAILKNVNIVTPQWLYDSIEANEWLPEDKFRPSDLPSVCRLRNAPNLFNTGDLIYVSPNVAPSRKDISNLLEMGGAQLTNRQSLASVIIGSIVPNKTCLTVKWIFNSIFLGRLQSYESYSPTGV